MPHSNEEPLFDELSEYAEISLEVPREDLGTGESINTTTVLSDSEKTQSPNWLRRNLLKVSLAAFIGGSAVTIATNPTDKLEKDILTAAPWVGVGLATTEAMWIGGAALMAGSAGIKIGNPLTLKSRYEEVSGEINGSKAYKTGLHINTAGALGTASVITLGTISSLPLETWPGAAGLIAADIASTVAIRSGLYAGINANKRETINYGETEVKPKVSVRHATQADISRLADIDILLFDKAYGEQKPQKKEIEEMLEQRLANNPGWMFVSEVNGVVEGFVTAFKTNTGIDKFSSWEESTADGTLEGKVDSDGRYAYVANMTIKHEAVELGAEDMLLANLFANSIRDGVEYGYFVSRMPHFRRWLEAKNVDLQGTEIDTYAQEYLETRREEDGKRYDPQLRMYEDYGFKLKRMVPNAFEDNASMDYGVVFKAAVPPPPSIKKIKPARILLAKSLRQVAKHPKILKKVL
ncbi:MAG: hypothetical protein QFB86_02670 [Patescibacteria group bacterium]|nr:hypothetical protein [Patescibacteria group bacterium]